MADVKFSELTTLAASAVATDDIITTVGNLRARGVEFLSIPPQEYYDAVPLRLEEHNHELKEDIETLKRLG